MPYQAGSKYNGKIVSCEMTASPLKGTIGFEVRVTSSDKDEEGFELGMFPRPKTLWISPGAIDRTQKVLMEIGVTEEQLHDQNELINLTRTLKGNDCSFTVCSREYQGDRYLEIEWLNGPRTVIDRETKASLGAKAVEMFKFGVSSGPVVKRESEPVDDDVPF